MAKPISVGFTFATQSGPIPLSELDTDFATVYGAVNDFSTYGNYLVDTSGAANTITVTVPVGTTFTYSAGVPIQVQIAHTTTSTAVSINVSGLGAKAVVNADGTLPAVGQFITGQIIPLVYDGTSFRTMSVPGTSAGAAVTSLAGTANQIAVSASTGAVTVSLPQNVIIPTPASGTALTVNGLANTFAVIINGASTSGQSAGLSIVAGTTSVDAALSVVNQANNTNFFEIFGDGHGHLGPNSSLALSWTVAGNVTIAAPASGTALTVNGVAGADTMQISAPNTASNSFGPQISAGTNSSDRALIVNNAANSLNLFQIFGDGGVVAGSATGGDQGLGTINAQGLYVNGAAVTVPLVATKTSTTSRNTTTTVTADPNLVVTLPVGNYAIQGLINIGCAAGGTGAGFKYGLINTGTMVGSVGFVGMANGAVAAGAQTGSISGAIGIGTIALNSDFLSLEGWVEVTVAGTLSFGWAQNTSNANNTNVSIGSWMSVTPV
jgi:hypothetical protein